MPLYNSKNISNRNRAKTATLLFMRTKKKEVKWDGDTHLETGVRNYFFDKWCHVCACVHALPTPSKGTQICKHGHIYTQLGQR